DNLSPACKASGQAFRPMQFSSRKKLQLPTGYATERIHEYKPPFGVFVFPRIFRTREAVLIHLDLLPAPSLWCTSALRGCNFKFGQAF
ncbi:MAG: hypothetical protein PHS86_15275, partial [Syntrophaceae bacterium]|nr:hypothetical protein [Syntrophaceae bacterium]